MTFQNAESKGMPPTPGPPFNNGFQEAQVIAFIDSHVKDYVDLSFLPSGARFVSSVPEFQDISMPCRLVIASGSTQVVSDVTAAWLQNPLTAVEVLWNYKKDPDFAHSLLKLSNEASYSSFRKVNSTAHLVLSNNSQVASALPPAHLTPEVATLMEETIDENASVPPEVLKQLLWRHSYLLDQIGGLSDKIENLTQQLSQARAAHTVAKAAAAKAESEKTTAEELATENKTLVKQVADLESSLSLLREKYHALSNSRLGSITLKYWDRHRK